MIEEPITDTDLIACTRKKAKAVFIKWVLYLSYVIDTLTVLTIGYYGMNFVKTLTSPYVKAVLQLIIDQTVALAHGLATILSDLISLIPWWAFWGAITIVAVIGLLYGYSFLWCAVRELTEEDWTNGNVRKWIDRITGLGFVGGLAFSIAGFLFIVCFKCAQIWTVFWVIVFGTTLIIISTAWEPENETTPLQDRTCLYYCFRLPAAAWYKYHKKV